MELFDYIKNKDLAVATEIYNAKFESVEDVATLMNKIAEEKIKFNDIIREFNSTLHNIKVSISRLASSQERLKRFNEFKNSHIASLIQSFIENNTDDGLNAIKKEIEKSNNFGIHIIPAWKHGDGERMYGTPFCAYFGIHHTDTYYTFSNWDIDNDIQNVKSDIEEYKADVHKWIQKKEEMYDRYGFSALTKLFSRFEEENGSLMADHNWKECDIIEDEETYDYYY